MNNKMNHPLITVDGRTLMDRPLEPPNFVVDTLISQGLHILAGSPKVGKSWLALWLAVTVAKGEPVWNMTTKQGTTLYLCLEDSVLRIQNRLFEITEDAPDSVYFCTECALIGQGLEEQIAEFEKRMQDASETIDAEKGKNKKLSEMIGLLQEEIDRQRRQGESRTREYQAAQEKNRQLQEQVRQVEEKSKLYDEAAASIGSAILQAQQTAQSIVDEAGGQAKEIVDRANTQAQAITNDAQRFIDRVLQKMDDMQQEFLTLRGRMDESINQLNNRFAQLDEDIVHARELVTNIRERLTQQEEEQDLPGKPLVQPPEQRSGLDMTR